MKDLTNTIGYIYKITSPDGKVYIGQTINFRRRKNKYKNNYFDKSPKLWNSCQAHCWHPCDTIEIIEKCLCGDKKTNLNEREIYWIAFYDSFNNGLNCNAGGAGRLSCVISNETKEKLRKASTGRKKSPETIAKLKESKLGIEPWNKGGKWSEEQKEKVRLLNETRVHPNKGKPAWNKGKKKIKKDENHG